MDGKRPKQGKLPLESGLIGEADLKAAPCHQKHRRCLLAAFRVKLGYLSEPARPDLWNASCPTMISKNPVRI